MDNGPQFVSTEFQHFLQFNGVHPIMCSIFNPQENGLVERWNHMLKGGVQAFCSLDKPWEEGMFELLAQHRHMPATPQGPFPAELLFRRHTQMALEVALPNSGLDEPDLVQDHLTDKVQHLETKAIDNLATDELQWLASTIPSWRVHPGSCWPVLKGLSPYRGTYEVKKALRRYTFMLSDGQ